MTYGTSKYAALFEIGQNLIIVTKIASHNIKISIIPPKIKCCPKKINDHSTFSASCIPKTVNAPETRLSWAFFFQTRYAAIPINKNNVVHTGANTQLGGQAAGLTNPEYQPVICDIVKNEPITPAPSQIKTKTNNCK